MTKKAKPVASRSFASLRMTSDEGLLGVTKREGCGGSGVPPQSRWGTVGESAEGLCHREVNAIITLIQLAGGFSHA
jgi:hypothetical protein